VKIFIGMFEIAGYFTNLTKGFRELGVECTFFSGPDVFRFSQEEAQRTDNLAMRMIKLAWRKQCKLSRWNKPAKAWWFGVRQLFRLLLFVQAALRHDVFIFTGAQGFFPFWYWDLRILKFLGKKVLFVFLGSDHRPPYINGVYAGEEQGLGPADLVRLARGMKARLKKIERYAGFTVGHHLSAHFHEKPFGIIQLFGIPHPGNDRRMVQPPSRNRGPLRLLHAPSRPKVKGSDAIRTAVLNLRKKGYDVELVELTGKPNSEVLEELSRCAFVVDELYSDVRLAGLSTEAAVYGKPTIVGGYAEDGHFGVPGVLEKEDFSPILYCGPDKIEDAMEKLITDEAYRAELGERARRFVEERWTPVEVARRYLRLIEGTAPPSWFYDPTRIRYLHGYGLSESRLKTVLREVLKQGGTGGLQLSDKPELERLFMDFAQEGSGPV
jgi:glycosyltransferase involved in cell wall biosynthesis